MKHLKLVTTLAVVAAFAGAAFGDTITFNSPSGTLGTFQVYNPGPNSITAHGFTGTSVGSATNLFGKTSADPNENGLGIASNSDFEIDDAHFVQLDLSNITGPFSLTLGSTQANEGYKICSSSVLGTFGTSGCISSTNAGGTDPIVLAGLTHADQFISITAEGTETANILVDSISFRASPVPEPNSLLLLSTGILTAAGVARRKLHI